MLNDKTLQRVAIYTAQRWPKLQNQLNAELKPYNLREEFIIVINLILKGSKIAIPSSLNTHSYPTHWPPMYRDNKIEYLINNVLPQY